MAFDDNILLVMESVRIDAGMRLDVVTICDVRTLSSIREHVIS